MLKVFRIVRKNGDLYCDAERWGGISLQSVNDFYISHHRIDRTLHRQKDKEIYYEILRKSENAGLQQGAAI